MSAWAHVARGGSREGKAGQVAAAAVATTRHAAAARKGRNVIGRWCQCACHPAICKAGHMVTAAGIANNRLPRIPLEPDP